MGKWRDEHNRESNPYGGWEWGQHLDEELLRLDVTSRVTRSDALKRLGISTRCFCCWRRFRADRLADGRCERCVPHAHCGGCGKLLADSLDGRGLMCGRCRDVTEKLLAPLRLMPPDERQRELRSVRAMFPRPAASPPRCPYRAETMPRP